MRRIALLLIPVFAAALAACAGGARSIDVRMFDDMRYDPARFDVNAGDTVTFEVTNSGRVRHEFFIGALDEHRDHANEMREDGHSEDAHSIPAALSLEAGERGSLTYTFDEAGELLVGCHEPGHYEAGMIAPITIHP